MIYSEFEKHPSNPSAQKNTTSWTTNNLKYFINDLIFKDDDHNIKDFKLEMKNDFARLFNDEEIEWGQLKIQNETYNRNYIYILNNLTVKFPDLKKQIKQPNSKDVFCTDAENPGKCKITYKLMFMKDFEKLTKEITDFKKTLKTQVVLQFLYFLLLFMIVFCVMMTWFLIKLANAITRPVIELYELIKHIVDQGKGAKTKLSFKNTNRELNNLHRTFN